MKRNIKSKEIEEDSLFIVSEKQAGFKRSSQRDDEDSNKRRMFNANKMFGLGDDLENSSDEKEANENKICQSIDALNIAEINISFENPTNSPSKNNSNSQNCFPLASPRSQSK